jgi:hypothetical protein
VSVYPCFLDFEASGLANGSYPIEVGWNLPSGEVKSFLIRPLPSWRYWDKRAEEEVHGISRKELVAQGVDAAEICAVLCADLDGREVYADGGLFDAEWMGQLLAAGKCPEPTFRLCGCAPDLFFPEMAFQVSDELQEAARKVAGQRHRAGNDVRWLVAWLRLGREAGYRADVPKSARWHSENPKPTKSKNEPIPPAPKPWNFSISQPSGIPRTVGKPPRQPA